MRELHCLTVILAAGLLVGFLPACGVVSAHMISHRVPGQSGKETKQSPQAVLDKATAFFGPDGLGLTLHQRSEGFVAFQGGGAAGRSPRADRRCAEQDRHRAEYSPRECIALELRAQHPLQE